MKEGNEKKESKLSFVGRIDSQYVFGAAMVVTCPTRLGIAFAVINYNLLAQLQSSGTQEE